MVDKCFQFEGGSFGVAGGVAGGPVRTCEKAAHLVVVGAVGEGADKIDEVVGSVVGCSPLDGADGGWSLSGGESVGEELSVAGVDIAFVGNVVDECGELIGTCFDDFNP